METFLLFFVPLIRPVLLAFGGFLLLLFEVKMITEIVSNHDLTQWEKLLWMVAMVPLLPIAAPTYYILRNQHRSHYTHYA